MKSEWVISKHGVSLLAHWHASRTEGASFKMQPDGALRAANHLLAPIEEASGPVAIKLELVFGMRYSRFIPRKGEGTGGSVKGGKPDFCRVPFLLLSLSLHILPPFLAVFTGQEKIYMQVTC